MTYFAKVNEVFPGGVYEIGDVALRDMLSGHGGDGLVVALGGLPNSSDSMKTS